MYQCNLKTDEYDINICRTINIDNSEIRINISLQFFELIPSKSPNLGYVYYPRLKQLYWSLHDDWISS